MKTACTATPTSKIRTSKAQALLGRALATLLVVATLAGACASRVQSPFDSPAARSGQAGKPIVILVSLDGWRWDYLDRAQVPRLRALARAGVRAEGLIPPFPSKTFPSHYSIVTGLYPEHHGIISNNMLDARIGERFSMDAPTSKDSRWWGGEPLWITAQKQGQIAAAMFWPGSDVEINGVRPKYWRLYDGEVPNRDRVQEVLKWLRLPEADRPTFITLYFSDVDSVGHRAGPDSTEVLTAAADLDREIGALVDGVNALRLSPLVNYVIVSDHGMSQTSLQRLIPLDDYLDPATVELIDSSPVVGVWPRTITVDAAYRALKDKHPALAVYKREDLPPELHFSSNPRIPPVIGIAADGWTVSTSAQAVQWQRSGRRMGGQHGYDPRLRSMHGLFIASGPQFRIGVTVPAFENVHLYAMMCRVLGLSPAPNDGRADVTKDMFVQGQGSTSINGGPRLQPGPSRHRLEPVPSINSFVR
ncbi:MAG TPA: ectonucleotide pyrophosphatase/phosphodiesterase [Vicinamibacterales bacterium]|nr:ectonucleotide pyrophosphatase/phosphodiesterase [Vicinamibacterales bacterium]